MVSLVSRDGAKGAKFGMGSFRKFHWSADFSPPGVKRERKVIGFVWKISFRHPVLSGPVWLRFVILETLNLELETLNWRAKRMASFGKFPILRPDSRRHSLKWVRLVILETVRSLWFLVSGWVRLVNFDNFGP